MDQERLERILQDLARLQVLRELALIDSPQETVYDRITQIASKVIGVPVSLVSMVADKYQFFKSMVGLPEPWASDRRTPLSHSFCQYVVATNEPLVVSDARKVDFLWDNLAIPDLNVIGYLGMPLTLSDGKPLGSFCVIDSEPHEWNETEIAIVRELAQIIANEIELRAKVNRKREPKAKLDEMHQTIDALIQSLDTTVSQTEFLENLKAARAKFSV
ncbi:MAG: hypothetical protein CUN55_00290 [Phototrophicales bacterium]|nr:MAG: hypothetical protein CUN55_00290 [Phototrophicales bacterium]